MNTDDTSTKKPEESKDATKNTQKDTSMKAAQGNILQYFGKPFTLIDTTPSEPKQSIDEQVRQAMVLSGMQMLPPQHIQADGRFHRWSTDENDPRDDAGWYKVFADGTPAGAFGDHRAGISQIWSATPPKNQSIEEYKAHQARQKILQAEREAEEKKAKEQASKNAAYIWEHAEAAPFDHPYLQRKQVKTHGVRVLQDGRLVLPLYGADERLTTVQYISPDGTKRFHSGAPAKGGHWFIGSPSQSVYIAEGFATAATIHEATGDQVFIAYSAGNLTETAAHVRSLYQTQAITIVADNDKSGTGQAKAAEAAASYGCNVVTPPQEGDVNDYGSSGGDVKSLLNPHKSTWLIHGNSFLEEPRPIKWLIKGWLQAEGTAMVYGPSGSGKTFVVLDWMLHLSTLQDKWMDCIVHGGPVVYLCGEGHHGLRARVAAWATHHQLKEVGDIYISSSATDLDNITSLQVAINEISSLPVRPVLVVIDTLNRFFAKDENSAKDVRDFLVACSTISTTFSCTTLIVHHTGVNPEAQNRARGSSALKGAMDTEVGIKGGEGGTLTVVQTKVKDGEMQRPVVLDLMDVTIPGWHDEDGERVTSAVIERGSDYSATYTDKQQQDMDELKEAFEHAGSFDSGKPVLSYQMWKNYLSDYGHKSPESAKKELQPNAGRLVSRLLKAKIIDKAGENFVVIDPALSAVLSFARMEL